MKYFLFVLVSWFAYPLFVLAVADNLKVSETLFLVGTIASKSVSMTLQIQDMDVVGTYVYDRYSSPIRVSGRINNNNVVLSEVGAVLWFELSKITAVGKWSSKGGKSYDIVMRPQSVPSQYMVSNVSMEAGEIIVIFASGQIQRWPIEVLEDSVLFSFEDFNFDGFPDIKILSIGSIANSSYIYYAYNPDLERFEPSGCPMDEITNPKIIHSKKIVAGVSRVNYYIYIVKKIHGSNLYTAEFDYEKNKVWKRFKDIIVGGKGLIQYPRMSSKNITCR